MLRSAFPSLLFLVSAGLPLATAADCMGPYPPSMVRAFNQNCAKDPQMAPFCSCIMDEVQKNIPLADFIEIGNSAGGINGDPRFIKASKTCSARLPGSPAAVTPAPGVPGGASPANNTPKITGMSGGGVR